MIIAVAAAAATAMIFFEKGDAVPPTIPAFPGQWDSQVGTSPPGSVGVEETTVREELEEPRGIVFRGRLVDADTKQPISVAEVNARNYNREAGVETGVVDAKGCFLVKCVGHIGDAFSVAVTTDGYTPRLRTIVVRDSLNQDLGDIVLYRASTLRIAITQADGSSAPRCRIALRAQSDTQEDALGAQNVFMVSAEYPLGSSFVEIPGIRQTKWRVELTGGGIQSWDPTELRVDPGDNSVRITVDVANGISGSATYEDGIPAVGLSAFCVVPGTEIRVSDIAITDESGGFELSPLVTANPPDLVEIRIESDSSTSRPHGDVNICRWGTRGQHAVVSRYSRHLVRVISASGRAVTRYSAWLTSQPSPIPVRVSFETHEDGYMEVTGPPGDRFLWVMPEDEKLSPVGPVTLPTGEAPEAMEIRVPPARSLVVTVMDTEGDYVSDAELELVSGARDTTVSPSTLVVPARNASILTAAGRPVRWSSTVTDAGGRAELWFPAGIGLDQLRMWIRAKHRAHATSVTEVDGADSVRITMENGLAVSGRIEPWTPSESELGIVAVQRDGGEITCRVPDNGMVMPAGDGAFTIAGLRSGYWELMLAKHGAPFGPVVGDVAVAAPEGVEGIVLDRNKAIIRDVQIVIPSGSDGKTIQGSLRIECMEGDVTMFRWLETEVRNGIARVASLPYGQCLFSVVSSGNEVLRRKILIQNHVHVIELN